MIRRVLLLCLLFPVTLWAQPIHADPQKVTYASPAEWPCVSSQVHWRAPGVGSVARPDLPAHTHVDMCFPYMGVFTAEEFTVPFTLTLYHTNGKITSFNAPAYIKAITLNDGATLPLVGDRDGVVVFTGTVRFSNVGRSVTHGWVWYELGVNTRYDNGDNTFNTLRIPIWSEVDPTVPPVLVGDGMGLRVQSRGTVQCVAVGCEIFGLQETEFTNHIPVNGVVSTTAPWRLQPLTYNYGVAPAGTQSFEYRVDPDFHNLNFGTLLDACFLHQCENVEVLPTSIPDGVHKLMFLWRKTTADTLRELVTVLVWKVTVGAGGAAQGPLNSPFLPPTNNVPPPPPPPPPTPGPCATLIGQTQTVTFGAVSFHATVTGQLIGPCTGTLIPF